MRRAISIFNEFSGLKIERKKLIVLIAALDAHYKPQNTAVLSLAFVSHKRLTQLHADFCGDPVPTDVITFPSGDSEAFGDLCVSPQAALDYVKKHGGAPSEELCRYVIHGYLHLLGYDDLDPKSRRQMKQQETIGLKLAKCVGRVFNFSP